MAFSKELLDELLKGVERLRICLVTPMKNPKIRLMEGMLGAGLTAHLG